MIHGALAIRRLSAAEAASSEQRSSAPNLALQRTTMITLTALLIGTNVVLQQTPWWRHSVGAASS
jgi:hypothetical protein